MLNKLFSVIALLSLSTTVSQVSDGYWDNVRTTTETLILKAGDRKSIATSNFPEGTTEVVYRITLLDDNQKISSSLVSVLKAIPDPTGISQGTAGAIFLFSTISGDDKCKYAVFQENTDVNNYLKSGKTTNACFVQTTPINKDAKLLTSNSKCLLNNTEKLYFAFESDNWLMNQKIVLEVVPWIDKKSSRGWNKEAKQELLNIVNKQQVVTKLTSKDKFLAHFLDSFINKYKYSEFKQLLAFEKNAAIETITDESLNKIGDIELYYQFLVNDAMTLFKAGNTNAAISLIQSELIAKKRAKYRSYGALGDFYLLSKQFSKAEENYNQGAKLNPSEINFQLNLAHVYLFTNRISQAKEIYKKYKNENLFTGKTWVEQVKYDFKEFEKRGLPKDNFKKMLRVIE